MRLRVYLFILLILSSNLFFSCSEKTTFAQGDKISDLFNKKDITIVVTDSGLGGLSILADAEKRMSKSGAFRKVNFIFFNSLFSNEIGYNGLKTRKEKIDVFDSALQGMEKIYHPDLIIIGCNTLSVLYEKTQFSDQTEIPVIGIVEPGVELISQNLKKNPDSKVLLFATQTTVKEDSHKNRLVEKGFLEDRIITQACPDLGQFIERGYDSDETEMLILAYVDEALKKVRNFRSSLYVSLNCTHYGYSLDMWKKAFLELGVNPLGFIDPNSSMNNFLFPEERLNRFKNTDITVNVVSMVKIGKEKTTSIGKWIEKISIKTAEALRNYELKENLFEWEKYLDKEL